MTVLALVAVMPAKAQSTNTPANVFITAERWLMNDSGNRWTNAHGYIQSGTVYESQVNIGFAVEAGLHLKALSTNTAIGVAVENVSSTIGGASTLLDLEVTYVYDVKDVQLQLGAGPGDDFKSRRTFADVMIEAQKKTGANTHLYARVDYAFGDGKGQGNVPRVTAGFGGSF
jgi:hypothetical protein